MFSQERNWNLKQIWFFFSWKEGALISKWWGELRISRFCCLQLKKYILCKEVNLDVIKVELNQMQSTRCCSGEVLSSLWPQYFHLYSRSGPLLHRLGLNGKGMGLSWPGKGRQKKKRMRGLCFVTASAIWWNEAALPSTLQCLEPEW